MLRVYSKTIKNFQDGSYDIDLRPTWHN